MQSLQDQFTALVVGASGGIGNPLAGRLNADPRCARLVRLDRVVETGFDLRREETIEIVGRRLSDDGLTLGLVVDATGVLTVDWQAPEKSLRALDPAIMAEAFAINTIGPALLFKHFVALLPRERKSVFAPYRRVSGRSAIIGWAAGSRIVRQRLPSTRWSEPRLSKLPAAGHTQCVRRFIRGPSPRR
jgi:short-subunit dehydrogenase